MFIISRYFFIVCSFLLGFAKAELSNEAIVLSLNNQPIVYFKTGEFDTFIIDNLEMNDSFLLFSNSEKSQLLTISTHSASIFEDKSDGVNFVDTNMLFTEYLDKNFIMRRSEVKKVYEVEGLPVFVYFNYIQKQCREKFLFRSEETIFSINYTSECTNFTFNIKRLTNFGSAELEKAYYMDVSELLGDNYKIPKLLRKTLLRLGFTKAISYDK